MDTRWIYISTFAAMFAYPSSIFIPLFLSLSLSFLISLFQSLFVPSFFSFSFCCSFFLSFFHLSLSTYQCSSLSLFLKSIFSHLFLSMFFSLAHKSLPHPHLPIYLSVYFSWPLHLPLSLSISPSHQFMKWCGRRSPA